MYKLQRNLVNACELISLRSEHFFGDTFDVLCFHVYKLQTNLVNVCAQLTFLRKEPFFFDFFDVLCFPMYKLQAYFENSSMLSILAEKAMS